MSKNFRINLDLKRPDCTPLNGFKQGDNLSVINGTILQDSTPYNLTGLTLRANFKLPDGTVKFQNVTLTNAIEGEFSITVLSSVLEKTGIILADISVFKEEKKITSSTFRMTVAESVYNDGAIVGEDGKDLLEQILENEADRVNAEKIRKANEIVRIENEDIRKANEVVREDNEFKRKIGYSKMDTRIDNLVLGQGSQTEVIDARLDGITNKLHPTLKARLDDTSNQLTQNSLAIADNKIDADKTKTEVENARDGEANLSTNISKVKSQLAENMKYENQVDFIKLMQSFTSYKRLRYKKTATNMMELVADNGTNHVSYQMKKDSNDDFWKLNDCFVGTISDTILNYQNYTSNTGTWVTSSPPSYYTTQVGATFTGTTKSSVIKFLHYADDRGGIWEFVIDGDTKNKITISTWSSTIVTTKVDTIIKGLDPNKAHTVEATFKGDDPNHVPSSGAGTSRGWCYYDTSSTGQKYTLQGFDEFNFKSATLLDVDTNKEMALDVTYNGKQNWIPDHGVGTAFVIDAMKVMLDGVLTDITTLANFQWVECSEIKIIQHVNGRISGVNVADITVTHFLTKDGILNYNVIFKTLQDILINNHYPLMFPSKADVLNEFVTGLLNSKINAADESYYNFVEERDKVFNCCAVSSTNINYIGVAQLEMPLLSMRVGKITAKPTTGQDLKIWQRAIAPKVYWQSVKGLTLPTGNTLSWAGKVAVATIDNIYNIIKSYSS